MFSNRFRVNAFLLSVAAVFVVFLIKGTWIEAAKPEKPTSSRITARITQSGRPWMNLKDGYDSKAFYDGNAALAGMENAKSLSLFSADINRDGFPDLVTGYAGANGGLAVIRYGDPEAFGPTRPETIEGIKNGNFPASFLPDATALNLPGTPDFLAVGDFDRDGNLDILTAARGSSEIYLLSEDKNSGSKTPFGLRRTISLPGQITTLATGRDSTSPFDDLAVGVLSGAGAQILFYSTTKSVFEETPAIYNLASPADSIAINQLDTKVPSDLAVTTGNDVLIIHGSGEKTLKSDSADFYQSQIEHLQITPNSNVVIGDFIPDRQNQMELAVLSNDGAIHVEALGNLDTRPFTAAEILEKRQKAEVMRRSGNFGTADYSAWNAGKSQTWNEVQTTALDVSSQDFASSKILLTSGNLAASAGDEILVINSAAQKVEVLMNDTDLHTGNLVSMQRGSMTIETNNAPIAALPMRLGVMEQPGLILLNQAKTDPVLLVAAPEATFNVTTGSDVSDPTPDGTNNSGSLREAVQEANGNGVGADMITFTNNTPTLTIVGNDNSGAGGDLDINGSLTVMGNGAPTTILSTTYTATGNNDHKVFGVNQDGTFPSLAVGFTGVTIQNGVNRAAFDGSFQYTGGGGDFFLMGTGYSYSMTNVIVRNNSTTTTTASHGGGINVDSQNTQTVGGASSGTVTFTNVAFTGNRSDTEGGGLNLAADKHDVNVTSCTFGGPTAAEGNQTLIATNGRGGGIEIEHSFGGTVTISGTTLIQNNISASTGGGINIFANENVSITGASILNNTSNSSGSGSATGGGVSITETGVAGFTPTISLTNSTVNNNIATAGAAGQGGGVYFNSVYSATVSNTTISGNSADRGAGVFNGGGSGTSTLTINSGSTVSNNTASLSGGGVANVDFSSALTILNGITVDNNTAGSGGDGIDQTLDAGGTGSTMTLQGTVNVNSGDSVFISRGTLSVAGTANVTGGLTNAGGTVSIPGTMNLSRDFTFSSGTFSQSGGTVNFNGTVAQQITGGAVPTFFNLTDSNTAAALSVINNANTNGTLTINSNAILNPAATVIIGGAGTLTGSGTARATRIAATADFLNQYAITNKSLTNLTVDYFGNGAQTINALTYGNLRTSTSGAKTLVGSTTVSGSVLIGTGTTLTLAGNTLNVGGDFTNNGAFSGSFANSLLAPTVGGKIVLNGSVAQNINGTTATIFNDLQINNAAGVTFGQNGTVNGILTLTNGTFSQGANTLTIGSAGSVSRTNGYVIGKVAKIFGGAGSLIFPVGTANGYSPVNTTVSSGSGTLTINATQGVHPNVPMPGSAIARYWTITGTGMTASFTFNYLQSDVVGPNEALFNLIKINNGAVTAVYPNAPTSVIIDTTANTATINNISSFSDWTLGQAVPTAASSSIAGRVLTANGRAISQATLKLTDSSGRAISVRTNNFGNFNFASLPSGQNYIVAVSAKGYQFAQSSSVINLQQNISNFNFTATR